MSRHFRLMLRSLHAGFGLGQLPALAAAHPEAYTALIDCCLRCPLLKAADMPAAAQLLAPAVDAVLPYMMNKLLQDLAKHLNSPLSSSSSSGTSQARASTALLAVVLARSTVQLADAMEAAGPQLLL
jgi:hypothetical protein